MSPGRWLRSLAALVGAAALVAAAAGPVHAAYPASADSNTTAFSFNCIGVNDTYPAKLLASALAGYRNLGYATSGYSGTAFSKTQVLSRTLGDWGFYVRCTGGRYPCVIWAPTGPQTAAETAVAATINAPSPPP